MAGKPDKASGFSRELLGVQHRWQDYWPFNVKDQKIQSER